MLFRSVREGRENYRSLTTEHIQIHPGSSMFRTDPQFIVAGEIVRTTRMFAMSVSPLSRQILERLDPNLENKLMGIKSGKSHQKERQRERPVLDDMILYLGGERFTLTKIKGKKHAVLPYNSLLKALNEENNEDKLSISKELRGREIGRAHV